MLPTHPINEEGERIQLVCPHVVHVCPHVVKIRHFFTTDFTDGADYENEKTEDGNVCNFFCIHVMTKQLRR
jgi:hypothetical protein